MDTSVVSPNPGGVAARAALTPAEVKRRYFEFFPAGTHREVLIVGDLVEQFVHWVKGETNKKLCGARSGYCKLCEDSATSKDVGLRQVEYYAPAFVRPWREREFTQQVCVFSAGALEVILKLIPLDAPRGHRLDVERYKHGNSARFKIKPLDGLPAGFPAALPAAFDVQPFVRARAGLPDDSARPMVFLPSFRCESVSVLPVGRPKPLDLPAADFEKVRAKIAEAKAHFAPPPATPPAVPTPAAAPTPPTPAPVERMDGTTPPEPAAGVVDAALKRRGVKPPSILAADPEAQAVVERKRALKNKSADELTAEEAVASGRTVSYVASGLPMADAIKNGKKGGVK
jgi:hypothetical protein